MIFKTTLTTAMILFAVQSHAERIYTTGSTTNIFTWTDIGGASLSWWVDGASATAPVFGSN